jgi:hypothetical protein
MKNISISTLFLLLFTLRLPAQNKDTFWVMFGGERVVGNTTGVSSFVPDDKYRLQNLFTYRFDINGKDGGSHFDFSWPTIWLGSMKWRGNSKTRTNMSTSTEIGMHYVEDNTIFKYMGYKYLNKFVENGFRFGLGGQFDWRRFGYDETYEPIAGVIDGQETGYGPLERKGRFGMGVGVHLVKDFKKWGHSRISFTADYSPGKIQSYSLRPEWLMLIRYKNVGIYSLISYRRENMWGNRQTGVTPVKKEVAINSSFRAEIGLAFNIASYIK